MAADIPFEAWIRAVFDHPVNSDKPWYYELDAEVELVSPAAFIDYGARLFRESAVLLGSYSDGQVNQGLKALIYDSLYNRIYALRDDSIRLELRLAFLSAIFNLNEQCFERRCTPHLSHLDRDFTPPTVSELNEICYMWWDIFIIRPDANDAAMRPLADVCVSVMEQCLGLCNPAVIEGALHGLGHFAIGYPDRVAAAIDRLLQEIDPTIVPELRTYAVAAHDGQVL